MTLNEAIEKLQTLAQRVADTGVEIMREEVPKRTNELADSIFSEISGDTVFIGTEKAYAKYVEYGRGEVRPKGKKNGGANVLHWDDVFAMRARPTKPNDFVGRTAKRLARTKFL